jgi:hypothetical protein
MIQTHRRNGVFLLVLGALGCHAVPAPPVDTGARATAQDYYEALVQQDWKRAYQTLHPDSRARCSEAHFTRLARAYRSEATVHVVLAGSAGAQARRYKDAVVLRTGEGGWGVILPPRFGQARR